MNRPTLDLSALILRHDAGPNLNFVAKFEHTSQDTAAGNAAFQLVDVGTGFVHVKGSDDHQSGGGGKVTLRYGDLGNKVFVHCVDVEFELGGDRDDGGAIGYSAS